MKHLLAILLGGLVNLGILFVIFGPEPDGLCGKTTFFGFLFMWLIISFGLVLIPYLLGSWLLGLIILQLISLARGDRSAALNGKVGPNHPLASFVQRSQDQGRSDADIMAAARRAGWSEEQIQEAVRRAAGPAMS